MLVFALFLSCVFASTICPLSGQPSVSCDVSSQCLAHCCLTSGLCPSSSCVSSFDAANDALANCENKCLKEVACTPFNPTCIPHDRFQHCIGTVTCLTAACDGRTAGDICLYDGDYENFKICNGIRLPSPPVCVKQVQFDNSFYTFNMMDFVNQVNGQFSGGIQVSACAAPLTPATPATFCLTVQATPGNESKVPAATDAIVAFVNASNGVTPGSVVAKTVSCNV